MTDIFCICSGLSTIPAFSTGGSGMTYSTASRKCTIHVFGESYMNGCASDCVHTRCVEISLSFTMFSKTGGHFAHMQTFCTRSLCHGGLVVRLCQLIQYTRNITCTHVMHVAIIDQHIKECTPDSSKKSNVINVSLYSDIDWVQIILTVWL